ncbi:hypothetical protein AAMO2058_001131800 [Amorphochlora amoebiformis]
MAQQPNESVFKGSYILRGRTPKPKQDVDALKSQAQQEGYHKQEEPQAQTYDTQIHQAHQDAKKENGAG